MHSVFIKTYGINRGGLSENWYRTTIEQDLQAWQKLREQRGLEGRKSGPMIDPASYGGYQGAYAPEWRQYTPPSPRPVSIS